MTRLLIDATTSTHDSLAKPDGISSSMATTRPSATSAPPDQKRQARALSAALFSSATLGGASSFGDWLWAKFLTDGAILPALIHGLAIFALLALVLALSLRSGAVARRLLPTLPLLGVGLAGVFYPIASIVGYLPALLVTWVGMWIGTALLLRWACDVRTRESVARALLRGSLAAIGSGLAFWAISGIWTGGSSAPVNYLVRGLKWAFAFAPGLVALLVPAVGPDRSQG